MAEPAGPPARLAARELVLPGDDLIPEAEVVMDRHARLDAPVETVWPWLVQLGKGRGGWYLTRRLERLIPRRHRALRAIDPSYQRLEVGDRVADYGPDGWFQARVVDPPHTLVWWSERGRDLRLTWALVLDEAGPEASDLHIRLRINRAIGRRAPGLVSWGAERFDAFTIRIMVAGLRERLADTA